MNRITKSQSSTQLKADPHPSRDCDLQGQQSRTMPRRLTSLLLCSTRICVGIFVVTCMKAYAQIDPEARELLHLGVNQSLHDDSPQAHYIFYYWNMPDFPSTNQVLRLVIAPTYLDSE